MPCASCPADRGRARAPPSEIDRVVDTLHFLYGITGRGQPLFDWLGVALHIEPAVAETEASLAIRDILLSLQQPDDLEPEIDEDDADEAAEAAELFATIPAEDLP
jgi:hypothetical protein